jgi:hypothetical protein
MMRYLWRVEHYRRESRWHFTVQANLDTCLNFVLCFYKRIKKLVGMDNRLAIVSHQPDESGIPFIDDLRECRRSGAH